jgi:hypothetical protein
VVADRVSDEAGESRPEFLDFSFSGPAAERVGEKTAQTGQSKGDEMIRRVLLLISLVGAVVIIGATVVVAVTGQATGGGCRTGVDTDGGIVTPAFGGTVVSSVSITKTCPGIVVGQFTTETDGSGTSATDFLRVSLRATCTSTGGLSNPCTVGEVVFAQPDNMRLDNDVQGEIETRGANAVFPNIRRGVWRFDAIVAGDGTIAQVIQRTFHVEAFNGGPSA